MEDMTQGLVSLTEVEINELILCLKKRVIALSDPNKFDLEQSWAKIGGVTAHITSQDFLNRLDIIDQDEFLGEVNY